MRAAILHPLGIRGIARYCHNLANAVAPHLDRCELITSSRFEFENSPRRYELVPAFRLWRVGARDNRKTSLAERILRPAQLAARFARFETSYLRAARRVRDEGIAVLHAHEVLHPREVKHLLAMRAGGARLVMTCHNVETLPAREKAGGGESAPLREALRRLYGAADAVVLHSPANRIEFEGIYPETRERLRVIPHGCEPPVAADPSLRSEGRALAGAAASDVLAVCFGEVKPYKGIDLLLDAFPRALRLAPALRLRVAGLPTDAGYAARLEAMRRGLGADAERVTLDFRYLSAPEADLLLRAADIAVLPYRRVYQSGVLSQSFTYGLPVVVTDRGGLGETVRGAGAGSVAPPDDPAALAEAIAASARDPQARGRAGRAAAEAAAGPLSWEAAGRATAALYTEIVARGGAAA